MRTAKRKDTRTKRGHLVVAAPPTVRDHGRPLAIAAAKRTIVQGDVSTRYMVGALERRIAKARGDAKAERTAKRRADRARKLLLLEPTGLEELRRINAAIAAAAPAVRTAAKAHTACREYAVRAALSFLQAVREHEVTSSAAIGKLGSTCAWSELEAMLRDRAFALGPSGPAPDDGGPTFAETVKLGATCEATARHAEGWGLHLEEKAREARPPALPAWMTAPPQEHEQPIEATTGPADDEDSSASIVAAGMDNVETGADEMPSDTPTGDLPRHTWPPLPAPGPQGPPAPPIPKDWTMQRQADGGWRMGPPPRKTRPGPQAIADMKKRGLDVSRWEEPE